MEEQQNKRILLQVEERDGELLFVTNDINHNDILKLATYLEIISESFKQKIINETEKFEF